MERQSNEEREQLKAIFVSLTAAELVWDYVDKVLRYCVDHRVSNTIKTSREVKRLRSYYDEYTARNMAPQGKRIVRAACKDFGENFGYDLLVMYHSLANELYRKYAGQEVSHAEMRTNALVCIMLLQALRSIPGMARLPYQLELCDRLREYVKPYELDISLNVERCQTILARRLQEVPSMECSENFEE